WSLVTGDAFQARVRIDQKFDGSITASILDSESIDYLFGYNDKARKAFQRGNRISLEGPLGKKSFQLNGTRKAVNVLQDCADEYLGRNDGALATTVPTFEKGMTAYNAQDFAEALANWRPLAEQGDARLQGYVGEMYRDGEGVAQDYKQAVRWFRLAADQGNDRAQNSLGLRYYKGQGVATDFKKAAYWFKAAAKQGNAAAQNNLGEMYRDGEGVALNRNKAKAWFRKAAKQGNTRGQTNLDAMLASDEPPVEVLSDDAADIGNPFTLEILGDNLNAAGDTVLHPGDKIDVMFTALSDLSVRSWVGFVQNNAAQSPEPDHYAQEIVNGRIDGVMTLTVPGFLGEYRLWMYDRQNGILLVDVPLRIEIDKDSAALDLPGGPVVQAGEVFDVDFRASPNYGAYSWIAIVGIDTPRDTPQGSIDTLIGRVYLDNRSDGRLTFSAPTQPGKYLLRMQEQGFKKTLTELVLSAVAPEASQAPDPVAQGLGTPLIAPIKPVFKPDEPIEVQFSGLPAMGQDWLAISALDHSPEQYFELVMLEGKPAAGQNVFTALPEGEYEVRVYLNWPDGGYNIAASSRVVVASRPAPPRLALPVAAPAAPLPVAAIAPPGAPIALPSGSGDSQTGGATDGSLKTPQKKTATVPVEQVNPVDKTPSVQTSADLPETVAPETANVNGAIKSGEVASDETGYINIILPVLPDDPFKRHEAPKIDLPDAGEMAKYIPVPDPGFDELRPPLQTPAAPKGLGQDIPAADSWPYAALGNLTMQQVIAALDIKTLVAYDNLNTVYPANWDNGGPPPYRIDGNAMRELYGGDESQTPPLNGWSSFRDESLTKYVDGLEAGFRIEFRKGAVSELRRKTDEGRFINLEFFENSGQVQTVTNLIAWEVPDGPKIDYFPDGSARCIAGRKGYPEKDVYHENGRTACLDENGLLSYEQFYDDNDDTGVWRQFENGQLTELNSYVKDRKNGIQADYRGENLTYWGVYRGDKRNGPYENYTVGYDGVNYISERGTYVDDEKTGTLWSYNEGKLVSVITMANGQKTAEPFVLDKETGLLERMEIPADGTHKAQVLAFDHDGAMQSVETKDEKGLQGVKFSVNSGYLILRTDYLDGQKNGLEISYYTDSDGGGHPLNDAITYVNGAKKGRAIRYWYDGELDYEESN
ncbi:MAG: hypothetical protein GXP03_04415, partial [Alphaproteobacteria bacterium]|nr:hypothetical protein [Alphaproteobacteria bacterium]